MKSKQQKLWILKSKKKVTNFLYGIFANRFYETWVTCYVEDDDEIRSERFYKNKYSRIVYPLVERLNTKYIKYRDEIFSRENYLIKSAIEVFDGVGKYENND